MPRVEVNVVEARGLPDSQWLSKPDPYIVVRCGGYESKTQMVEDTLQPVWNEKFEFEVSETAAFVRFELWNENVVSDDFVGQYQITLAKLRQGAPTERWVRLQQCPSNAELHVVVTALDFGADDGDDEAAFAPPPPQFQQQAPPPPPAEPANFGMPWEGGIFHLVPRHAQHLMVDVAGGETEPGTRLLHWSPHGGPNQAFRAAYLDGFLTMTPMHAPHLRLDGGPAQGHNANVWSEDAGNLNQQFRLEPAGNGFFVMRRRSDEGQVLEARGGANNQGADVVSAPYTGAVSQQYKFVMAQ